MASGMLAPWNGKTRAQEHSSSLKVSAQKSGSVNTNGWLGGSPTPVVETRKGFERETEFTQSWIAGKEIKLSVKYLTVLGQFQRGS
jgi:hypothetical protein